MKVSKFKQCKYHDGDTTTAEILNDIKSGKFKEQVIALRQLIAEGKTEEYGRLKKELPGFTVSGTFKGGRKTEHLHEYNRNMVIDVDKLPPSLLAEAAVRANQSPYTYACFISPGGEGLKIICKTTATPETHKEVFNALKEHFEHWLNLYIDESGSDIPRLCLYSYDPELYHNENAETFNPKNFQQMEKTTEITDHAALFEHCKRYTDKKKVYSEGNRNNYIHLLAHNCNRKGLSEEQCLYFCCEEFDLDSMEVKATIQGAYSNKEEHDTDDIKEDKPKTPNIDIIERFLSNRYQFRYNVVTGRLEFKGNNDNIFQPISDYKENSFLREVQKAGIKCNNSLLRTILNSDFCDVYNPFIDYFRNLPPWDGQTDHILELSKTITTTHTDLWQTCFRKWLVAMVGSAINDQTINHTVIVFSGKQGVGKTTWLENLIPHQLKSYLYSGTINPNNKDTLIHLSECLLINLDELENLNKSEIGSLKEIITKSHIRIRRAYGHNNESLPRRASFAGSVNTAQFLNDTTGSRRFLCFEVTDIAYQHSIDLLLVYAQALHLYKHGFQFWFDKEEINAINANNEQYQLISVEEELLLTWFEKVEPTPGATYLTTSEIATKLAVHSKINVTSPALNHLGKALHKHKFHKRKKQGRQVYAVRERTYLEVESASKEPEAG